MTVAVGRRALITGGAPGPGLEIAAAARTNPLGRNGTAGDVAAAVLWFLDEGASFITGVVLDVDGGAHLGYLPGA